MLGMARVSVTFALFLLPLACTGADGDPCQENDDCNDGLTCCSLSASSGARGLCQAASATCNQHPDSGVTDAGPDGGPVVVDDAGPIACEVTLADGGVMSTCGGSTFCQGMGCPAGSGLCLPVAATCPGVLAPVCGCDGRTYLNECEATRQRTRVVASGECTTGPPDAGPPDAGPPDAGPPDAGPADAG